MDFRVEVESPEKRVRAWLEQSNGTIPGPVECEVDDAETLQSTSTESTFANQSATQTAKRHHRALKHINNKYSDSDSGCRTSLTYRRSYSFEESSAIIRYIVNNEVYSFIKGNLLWKKMEYDEVCSRSWQSMKNQFIRKIYPNLGMYLLDKEKEEKFNECMKPSTPKKTVYLEPGQRGWRRNGNYYSESEDKEILNYICQKQRYLRALGNSVWQVMEDERVLPDRSWQSMKSRYLSVILHDLEKYDLKESNVRKMLSIRKKNGSSKTKQKRSAQSTPEFTLHRNVVDDFMKRKIQQDIRQHSLRASAYLAAKMEESKSKAMKNGSKEKCDNNNSNVLPAEENIFSDTQSFVKNDLPKNYQKNNTNVSGDNVERHVFPTISQNSASSSKIDIIDVKSMHGDKTYDHPKSSPSDVTKPASPDHNCKNAATTEIIFEDKTRENIQVCEVAKNCHDSSEASDSENSIFHLGRLIHSSSSSCVTDSDNVKKQITPVERERADDSPHMLGSCSNDKDVIDVNGKERNSPVNLEHSSYAENPGNAPPRNNVLCENVAPETLLCGDSERLTVSEECRFQSQTTTLDDINDRSGYESEFINYSLNVPPKNNVLCEDIAPETLLCGDSERLSVSEECRFQSQTTTLDDVNDQSGYESEFINSSLNIPPKNDVLCGDIAPETLLCGDSERLSVSEECRFQSQTTTLDDVNDRSGLSLLQQRSPRVEDKNGVAQMSCSYSHTTVQNCRKCSAPHNLSPSSN